MYANDPVAFVFEDVPMFHLVMTVFAFAVCFGVVFFGG